MHKTLDFTMSTPLKLFLVCCLIFGQEKLAFSQKSFTNAERNNVQRVTANGSDVLIWSDPVSEVKYDGSRKSFVMFDGAVYLDDTSLPFAVRNIRVSAENTIKANLDEMVFEPLTNLEKEAIGNLSIETSIEVNVDRYTERKQSFERVSFVPLRKNPTSGQLEKLTSFKLQTRLIPLANPKATGANVFAQSSVLNGGSWYKVAVSQDGIHRITYNDLQTLGVDVASIDPRRLNVYGNGGGMLPNASSKFRHDDLQQNAIEVVGESDGRFDQGDYIVFYAKGPHSWVQDSASCGYFRHEFNSYSDQAYYFVTLDRGMGRRVASEPQANAAATHTVTTFVDHQFHESDAVNLIKSGREWYGEIFDIQTTYDFDFGFSNVRNSDPSYIGTRFLSGSSSTTSYSVKANGTTIINSTPITGASGGYGATAISKMTCSEVSLGSGNTNVALTYSKGGNPSAVGWLDYVDVIVKRNLLMAGAQMAFRDPVSVGIGNIAEFQVGNSNSSVRVWEVTDPTNVTQRALNLQGSTASFKVETDSLRQFIAFNGSSFYSVTPVGQVDNQNLHGLSQANMIIVAHPNFVSEAERLAEFHRQNETNSLSVHIVTPQQIYNEYSSGAQDISAIRDFMRMFYERTTGWQDMPRYLLLFGDASYDYKDRLADNTNYVPTYESVESLVPTTSYASDDYFGLLDINEGDWSQNDALDIGIGRFVVRTAEDARTVVDKIYRYEDLSIADFNTPDHCTDGSSAIVSPDWRNRICFVADDEDSNMHVNQADQLAVLVDTMYPEYNISKIYLDSYVQESTPGGQRYPEATIDINNTIQRGVLIMNYTGHGGELGWTHERVLGVSDINSWTNFSNLAVMVTATCEFTRYDDPSRVSAGELVHLNPNGGGIALFTTSRLVYSAPNFTLNRNFYLNLLVEQLWGPPTMGDVIRMTKVASGGSVNNRNFSLIGDPAQRLAFPLHKVETLAINGEEVNSLTDTINALELVTVTGRMRNRNGQLMPDFDGVVYPTVFDKNSEVSTLANDPGSSVRQFTVQKNLIYKGKASVKNGEFSFTFVVPRDIAYNYDFGRISYYAEGEGTNANGYFEEFIVGGSSDGTQTDENGPVIRLYMNDEGFAYGGTTDESPSLFAIVADSNGVNTVGNGIGHDITAVLDDNASSTINLNDFYQADLDSYQSGKVLYPFSNLSEGTHNLKLKIWDVYNNSSEAYTEFVVAESAQLALEHVLNYPNPFTTRTSFMFEHNQPCNSLDVQVQVFTVSGKLVKTINETVLSNGFRNDPIEWDGLDDYGQKIGRGVYLYNLKVKTPDGQKAEQIERLVILN
ncbi:MAG: type IX secretion system sortase PorU [Flavobacteriales bacterium]|nr:type IX secretion system sortase PorU [Flavobacteriales bacterium]